MSYLESAGFTTIKPVNGDKYDIVGGDSPLVNIKLAEGETIHVVSPHRTTMHLSSF